MLCTSGFVHDIMFSHNGANGPALKTMRTYGLVGGVMHPGSFVHCSVIEIF